MRSIVLSGFMATGKTTLGPLVAARLGLPFLDTDREIERRTGQRIPDLWRSQGEAAFRLHEEELVRELFADKVARVLAFGGGAVTMRGVRHLALDHAFVVTLAARPETLLSRIPDVSARPLLAGRDPRQRIATLLEERSAAYAECHLRLATDELSLEDATTRVVTGSRRERIAVPLGARTYAVEIVDDAPLALTEALTALAPSSVVVVTDENLRAARGDALGASLRPLDVPVTEVTLRSGEEHKTLASVEAIWDAAVGAHVDRGAVILGFGGGVVGDLAGFAASTLLRGVRLVQAPTTLLAMVDASVGGKTGFDLASGKNLIGSFHQPASVIVDLAHLATLPPRDRVAGLAEIVKMALAFDESLWLELEANAELLRGGDVTTLRPMIHRAIALKAAVVRDDEREAGARALLNLGHTLGHALEAAGGYSRYRHGEAVALGMVIETLAAERLGLGAPGVSGRVRVLLDRLGLPTEVSVEELAQAWPLVSRDKKRMRSSVALPLARSIGDSVVEPILLHELARGCGVALG